MDARLVAGTDRGNSAGPSQVDVLDVVQAELGLGVGGVGVVGVVGLLDGLALELPPPQAVVKSRVNTPTTKAISRLARLQKTCLVG